MVSSLSTHLGVICSSVMSVKLAVAVAVILMSYCYITAELLLGMEMDIVMKY